MTSTTWNKIFRNVLSNLAGTAVGLIVGFFLMPFVVHRIGLTGFGIWMLVNSFVGYMGLLDLGLSPTLIKKSAELLAKDDISELNHTVSTIFIFYLLIGAIVGIVIFGLGFVLPNVFNVPPEDINTFKVVLWIVGLQAGLSFPMAIWSGLTCGLQDFHFVNGIAIITNLLKAALTILLLISGFGLISLIWLGFGLSLVSWLAGMFWVRRRIPHLRIRASQFKWARIRGLARFSGIMFIGGIAGRILFESDRIIIGLFLPLASITIYEVGLRVCNYSRNVLYSTSSIMPTASYLDSKEEKARLRALYLTGTKYIFSSYLAVVVALLLFGKDLIHLWMGKGFEASLPVMYALLIGSLFQSQNIIAYYLLIGINKLRVFTKLMVLYPIVNIFLSVLFVLKWGLIGVALATTITLFLGETFFLFHILKIFEVRLSLLLKQCHIAAILSLTPVLFGCLFMPSLNSWATLALSVIAFFFLWFVSFLAIGASGEERSHMRQKIARCWSV